MKSYRQNEVNKHGICNQEIIIAENMLNFMQNRLRAYYQKSINSMEEVIGITA